MKQYNQKGQSGDKVRIANTRHLKRIIEYLKENKNPICKTKIQKDCLITTTKINDALIFLLHYNFIEKNYDKGKSNLLLYKIKENVS